MRKTKRFLVVLLTLAMIVTMGTPAYAAVPETGAVAETEANEEVSLPESTETTEPAQESAAINNTVQEKEAESGEQPEAPATKGTWDNGKKGSGQWNYDEKKNLLTIKGTGELPDYDEKTPAPWSGLREEVQKIEVAKNVTAIGEYAFAGFESLAEIALPGELASVGEKAFRDCEKLKKIIFAGTRSAWESVGIAEKGNAAVLTAGNVECTEKEAEIAETTDKQTAAETPNAPEESSSPVENHTEKSAEDSVSAKTSAPEENEAAKSVEKSEPAKIAAPENDGSASITEDTQQGTVESIDIEDGKGISKVMLSKAAVEVEMTEQYHYKITMPSDTTELTLTFGSAVYETSTGGSSFTTKEVSNLGSGRMQSVTVYGQYMAFVGNRIRKYYQEYTFEICCLGEAEGQSDFVTDGQGNLTAYRGEGGAVEIPEAVYGIPVTTIRFNSFTGNIALTSVKIPQTVTEIMDGSRISGGTNNGAFSGCTNLTGVAFSGEPTIKRIGDYAFYDCEALAEIELPASVTAIGDYAFYGCDALKTITIHNAALEIGTAALPESGFTIRANNGSAAHKYAVDNGLPFEALDEKDWDAQKPVPNETVDYLVDGVHFYTVSYDGDRNGTLVEYMGPGGDLVIPADKNIRTIADAVFKNRSSITSVVIPESVTELADGTPDPLLYSATGAFKGCDHLNSVTFAGSPRLKKIGASSFSGCTALKRFAVPETVTEIGGYAFYGCSALQSVSFPEQIKLSAIAEHTFRNTALTEIELPASVTTIGEFAFEASGLRRIVIPEGVISVGGEAFAECGSLMFASLPESLESLGARAFASCAKLSTVRFAGGIRLERLQAYTFGNCKALWEIEIPASVTAIGDSCFQSSGLTRVALPETVQVVGQEAFGNCLSLKKILVENDRIDINNNKIANNDASAFAGVIATMYGHSGSTAEAYAAPKPNITFVADPDGYYAETPMVKGLSFTGEPAFDKKTNLAGHDFKAGALTMHGGGEAVSFNAAVTEYDGYVNEGTKKVNFLIGLENNAGAEGAKLSLCVNGGESRNMGEANGISWNNVPVELEGDTTTAAFTVTDCNGGNAVTYTVHIKKCAVEELDAGQLIFSRQGYSSKKKALNTVLDIDGFAIDCDAAYIYKTEQTYAVLEYLVVSGAQVAFDDPDAASAAGHTIEGKGTVTTEVGRRSLDQYEIRYRVDHSKAAESDYGIISNLPRVVVTKDGTSQTISTRLQYRSVLDGVYTPDHVVEVRQGDAGQYLVSDEDTAGRDMLIGYAMWSHYLSLGGPGGYAIYKYDEPIQNDPNNPYGIDFFVVGNTGPMFEPGMVAVSEDGINWYYLAGQNHYEDYMSYDMLPLEKGGHTASYWTSASHANGLTAGFCWGTVDNIYTGETVQVGEAHDDGWGGSFHRQYVTGKPLNPYDGHGNTGMDISWAVDLDGKPVHLDAISYIKAQSILSGTDFGGYSTELGTIVRTDNYKESESVGVTEGLSGLKVCGVDVLADKGEKIGNAEYHVLQVPDAGAVTVEAAGAADDVIYINKERFTGQGSYTTLFGSDGTRTVRILVQNGEKEPYIYVVKLEGADPESASRSTELVSAYIEPGDATVTPGSGNKLSHTVANTIESVKLSLNTMNPLATISLEAENSGEMQYVDSGVSTEPLALDVGENRFKVKVMSANGENVDTYTLVITRKAPGTDSDGITVDFTFNGDVIHSEDPDGHSAQTWIDKTTLSIPKGSTVKYVTDMMLMNRGIEFDAGSGNYISKIKIPDSFPNAGEWLEEFTNGTNSGWMFRLNGRLPALGYQEQALSDGDEIVWFYTDDFTKEGQIGGSSVEEVEELIRALPDPEKLTLDNEKAVSDAQGAYSSLSPEDQANVSKELKDKLDEAVKRIAELRKEAMASVEDAYKNTGDYLNGLIGEGGIPVGQTGGDWISLGLARSDRMTDEQKKAYYNNVVEFVRSNADDKEQLDNSKSTENARIVVALTAAGYDPTDVDGHNLLQGLTDMDFVEWQGINGPIWALIAFDSHGYEIPKVADGGRQVTREGLIEEILLWQLGNGGWNLSGLGSADPDVTGMALQALAPYYNSNEEVKAAVDEALAALSTMQLGDGSFASSGFFGGGANIESCAQVVVALTALGINPATDERFVKNGSSVVDALMGFYVEGGGFRHMAGGKLDGMSTEQGYYALAAYARFLNGQNSLYDMSDVTLVVGGNGVDKGDGNEGDGNEDDGNKGAGNEGDGNKGDGNVGSGNIDNSAGVQDGGNGSGKDKGKDPNKDTGTDRTAGRNVTRTAGRSLSAGTTAAKEAAKDGWSFNGARYTAQGEPAAAETVTDPDQAVPLDGGAIAEATAVNRLLVGIIVAVVCGAAVLIVICVYARRKKHTENR